MQLLEKNPPLSRRIFMAVCLALGLMGLGSVLGSAQAQMNRVAYDTRSEFQRGAFTQTVLEGTEENPDVKMAFYKEISWSFEDGDFFSGWSSSKKGSLAIAEVVSGQIHLKAQRESSVNESSGLFVRSVTVPDKFAVEYRILFKRLGPSGVVVPADAPKDQPTGACARLDVLKLGRGALRVDIFTDKMVSFWARNAATKDYPTTAYLNVATQMNRWYTLRFEGNFLNPE
jgi:hypothetical protein